MGGESWPTDGRDVAERGKVVPYIFPLGPVRLGERESVVQSDLLIKQWKKEQIWPFFWLLYR